MKPKVKVEQAELHNKKELPIYTCESKMLSTQKCLNILLNAKLDTSRICTKVPFSVDVNSVFIVDLNQLDSEKDLLCDDMGVWKWGGSCRKWCTTDEEGTIENLGDKSEANDPRMCYRIWKRYYTLKSNPDIRRMVILLEGQ